MTVKTSLDVVGATNGVFHFTVASPAGAVPLMPRPAAKRVAGDTSRFRSRPDLVPAAVTVTKRTSRSAPGDIFVAPQFGPLQAGPMILDDSGQLVWFKPMPTNGWSSDFRVQSYGGKPVLTWWQGYVGAGIGVGEGVIYDSAYRPLADVKAANGLRADLHEFELTPRGSALITAYYPVYRDASSVKGSKRAVVMDSVVQEIDVPTGLVLYQWNSLDHVPLSDSYLPLPRGSGHPFDYFHINSVQEDTDGNLVVSARNTSAGYKLDHTTGAVRWRLGGKHSSFRMGSGTGFAFQHDVRMRPGNLVTLFDDGAGPPSVHSQSRGLALRLDGARMTATLSAQQTHSPRLLAHFEGNLQLLANGDSLVGWGEQPYITEFDARGQTVFEARFVDANPSYRAYRFPWTGTPAIIPAATASTGRGGPATVYASWNGATTVASWRVLAGASASTLKTVATASKRGFETAIAIPAGQRYTAVQALDSQGGTLATSRTVAVR